MNATLARERPAGIPLSTATNDSDITVLRISEEAEEDAELLVFLEQQGLVPGVRAHVTDVSQVKAADAGPSSPEVGPAWACVPHPCIGVLPGDADPGLFHQVQAVARLGR